MKRGIKRFRRLKPSRKMGMIIFYFSLLMITIAMILAIADFVVTGILEVGLIEIILGVTVAILSGVWGFQSMVNFAKEKYRGGGSAKDNTTL